MPARVWHDARVAITTRPGPPSPTEPPAKPTKAQAAWSELNTHQQTWLRAIFNADQDAEDDNKGAFVRGDPVVPASVWRWLEYEPTRRRRRPRHDPDAGERRRGLLQHHLDLLEVRNSGAGSTIRGLAARLLIEVRYEGDDPHANRMAIRLTQHGRATARAGGADDTRPARPTRTHDLSETLWGMLAQVARAGEGGISLGYRRVHPAWERLVERGLTVVDTSRVTDTRIRFTDDGSAYYRSEWATYLRMYPDVDAPHPDGEPVWPVEVDARLQSLYNACAALRSEIRDVGREMNTPVPPERKVDKARGPELARAAALHNRRVASLARTHALLAEHHTELYGLLRVAVGRYLAAAAAVVTAVVEGADPVRASKAPPLVLGTSTDLPYPRVGIVGVDQDITTARPATSHKRARNPEASEPVEVSTADALDYAVHLADLTKAGRLARLMLRRDRA